MADKKKKPDTPEKGETEGVAPEETAHAVPSEEAQQIAGSAEDAALEAAEEAAEAGGQKPPAPLVAEPGGEGHAVPSEEALEVAAVAEDAALEARQEADDATAVEAASVIQRLPDKKPRSSACSPLARYSGMIFCADTAMPKSSMLPSSSTQVQT